MELLDRYLQAVGFWLPRGQRPDILAELAEEFRSQVEAREGELGRQLSDDEVEAMLQRWGNPLRMAERYLPPRYLIGPAFYPLYLHVLKVYLWVWVVPWLAVWLGYVAFDSGYRAAHPGQALVHTLSPLIFSTVFLLFFTTLAFVVLERSQFRARILDRWSPRSLPGAADPNRISRSISLWGVAWNFVLALWCLGWLHLPAQPGVRVAVSARIEHLFRAPVLLLLLALILIHVADFVCPWWTRRRAAIHFTLDCAGVLLALLPIAFRPWIEVTTSNRLATMAATHTLNVGALSVLLVFAACFLVAAVREGRRLFARSSS